MIAEMFLIAMCFGSTALMIIRQYYIEKRQLVMLMLLESIQNRLTVKELAHEEVIEMPKEAPKKPEKKLPGANRKPRTDEQKAMAAQKRKEWWEKKRASEKTIPEGSTEIKNSGQFPPEVTMIHGDVEEKKLNS